MKLRSILLLLSLLAFLSASLGGYFYYSTLKDSAFKEAERQAATRAGMVRKNLSSFLSENIRPVKTLAGLKEIQAALIKVENDSLVRANRMLDHFKTTLDADVCYVMNAKGDTIASSNRGDPDSFVGSNFSFRPYFQKAIQGAPFTYLALGTASGKRGAYYSHPVYAKGGDIPIGIAVIKASIELVEKDLPPVSDEIILVASPEGVVFISNHQNWLFHSLSKLSPVEKGQIAATQQFGEGPWSWVGLEIKEKNNAVGPAGNKYLMHQLDLNNYPGWKVMHLYNLKAISRIVSDPLIKITGPIVLVLCVLMGLVVSLLYRKASNELSQRKKFQNALRESEERYRSIYHNTPAMLHSIDPEGRLISVSDNWLEVLGYTREEVIGQKLTNFFTEDSRRYAEKVIIPDFFKSGFCKDIPYRFVKKNGERIDILLSAIGDRDDKGNVIRSLAVSIDVTERIRAEEALKLAKEELSRYSKNLERQVEKRTREISSILKYTPAVVYLKDKEGRYKLVNLRFEELFDIKSDDVYGKSDHDLFPKDEADQFRNNDLKVLLENRPYQAEEHVLQRDGTHTYLSVKFPIYDEAGAVSGVCGISTDVTAEKKAQEQLRRLSGSIIDGQEKERSAIARELHDELGQVLTALRMDAVWLQNRMQVADPKSAQRAATMCDLIDNTIEEVRGMAIRLRPGVLDDLGLVDALEWYTTDFERRTGITCVFEHNNIPAINNTVATAAYRITQETLTNVARHAAASRVEVSLRTRDGMLILTANDNGYGFNTADLSETEAVGIAGMRERANLVGGDLEVHSRPGAGTRINFKVPVNVYVN